MCGNIYVPFGLWVIRDKSGGNYCILNRLKKVLLPYWFIVIIVCPYLLVKSIVSWTDVLTDGLLLTSHMNGSWWFMQTYVVYVICFPLFLQSLEKRWVWIPLFALAILCFQPLATMIRAYSDSLHYILYYFPLFYAGMISQKMSLFEKLPSCGIVLKAILIIAVFALRFLVGWNVMNIGLIIIMIMLLVELQPNINDTIKKVSCFLGKMSMNMWLIHMFFISYGWHSSQPFIDLGWIYMESLVGAYVIVKLYEILNIKKR